MFMQNIPSNTANRTNIRIIMLIKHLLCTPTIKFNRAVIANCVTNSQKLHNRVKRVEKTFKT